ncbi:BglG family transcription antiterminator [Bacillus safensis]|uniref:BglG family transcription antiterminator n=1 Tax=Bacillus safensis TaxID=561879 RepID=UPI0021CA5746|nr:BglG family transcription antiterminator [Bacillus safensis]MCU0156483.1 BglG family transcription antiterminator [Bacillus safensis]
MLSLRQEELLKRLMQAEQELTSEEIARVIGVTSRTIRTDMKALKKILEEHGAALHIKRGAGYTLSVEDYGAFRTFLKTSLRERNEKKEPFIPNQPEDRVAHLLKRLLLSEDYIKLEGLAEELFVSESTVKNDLKAVRHLFSLHGLSISHRPKYGLRLTGDEMKLRYCMAEHVFQQEHANAALLPEETYQLIQDIVRSRTKATGLHLSEIGLSNLVTHIAIACKRIEEKKLVQMPEAELKEIQVQPVFQVAQQMAEDIRRILAIDFPLSEMAYIAIHLMGAKMMAYGEAGHTLFHLLDEDHFRFTHQLLAYVEEHMSLDIQFDKELIVGLSLHLRSAIHRFRYDMNIRNPYLPDIKRHYPIAFEAGVYMGRWLKEKEGVEIPEDEIGYLALHIGAAIERTKSQHVRKTCLIVCATGVASSQLLLHKLTAAFNGRLEIAGTASVGELPLYDLRSIDFIISTIPLQNTLPVPVIDVHTILSDDDIVRLKRFVQNSQDTGVLRYVSPALTFFQQDLQSREEVLQFFVNVLKEQHRIPEEFEQLLLEREQVSPTSFGHLVAIPHTIKPATDDTFCAICTLKKPVLWGENRVQVVCLLSIQKTYQKELQSLYQFLVRLTERKEVVEQLIKAASFEELTAALQVLEHPNEKTRHPFPHL